MRHATSWALGSMACACTYEVNPQRLTPNEAIDSMPCLIREYAVRHAARFVHRVLFIIKIRR